MCSPYTVSRLTSPPPAQTGKLTGPPEPSADGASTPHQTSSFSPLSCRHADPNKSIKCKRIQFSCSCFKLSISERKSLFVLQEVARQEKLSWSNCGLVLRIRIAEDSHTGRCTLIGASAPWPFPHGLCKQRRTEPQRTTHYPIPIPICVKPTIITDLFL